MWKRNVDPPSWQGVRGSRARIVIENAAPDERWLEERILRDAGYEVVSCAGPDGLGRQQCPVVAGSECPGIAEADVVVSSLRVEKTDARAVISGIRERYPDTPLIVEAPPAAVGDHADVLEGCHVVFPLTTETLVGAVDEVLAERGAGTR